METVDHVDIPRSLVVSLRNHRFVNTVRLCCGVKTLLVLVCFAVAERCVFCVCLRHCVCGCVALLLFFACVVALSVCIVKLKKGPKP